MQDQLNETTTTTKSAYIDVDGTRLWVYVEVAVNEEGEVVSATPTSITDHQGNVIPSRRDVGTRAAVTIYEANGDTITHHGGCTTYW